MARTGRPLSFDGGLQMRIFDSKRELRILALEDDRADSMLLRRHLKGGEAHSAKIYLEIIDTLAGAMQILNRSSFDVALLDLNVQDSRGLETFLRLHEIQKRGR